MRNSKVKRGILASIAVVLLGACGMQGNSNNVTNPVSKLCQPWQLEASTEKIVLERYPPQAILRVTLTNTSNNGCEVMGAPRLAYIDAKNNAYEYPNGTTTDTAQPVGLDSGASAFSTTPLRDRSLMETPEPCLIGEPVEMTGVKISLPWMGEQLRLPIDPVTACPPNSTQSGPPKDNPEFTPSNFVLDSS